LKKTVLYGKFARLFFLFEEPYSRMKNLLFPIAKKEISPAPKILLCCFASLGDVFLATLVIPYIKARMPGAKIGFICAPESLVVLQKTSGIDYIHTVPSWMKVGKSKWGNIVSLMKHSFFMYPKSVSEIRKVGYDVSVELHPFFPSCIPLAAKAGISRRVAFTSGGYEALITDPARLPEHLTYLPKLYPLLFEKIGIPLEELRVVTKEKIVSERKRIVFHMGTSDPRKLWEKENWIIVAKALISKGYNLVFTGKGKEDLECIKSAGMEEWGENLCDRLDFQGLSDLIKESKAIISIDSLPVHLAAFFQTPTVALYLYNESTELWLPEAKNGRFLVRSSCVFRNKEKIPSGTIFCERVTPPDVLSALYQLLGEFP